MGYVLSQFSAFLASFPYSGKVAMESSQWGQDANNLCVSSVGPSWLTAGRLLCQNSN